MDPLEVLLSLCMHMCGWFCLHVFDSSLLTTNCCMLLQRAAVLEKDGEMEVAHSVAAIAGETEVNLL